jgi:hypothetical protein
MLNKSISQIGEYVAAGKFRLKSRGEILKLGKTPNAHQVSMRSGISWPTVSKYLNEEEAARDEMVSVDLAVLYGVLTDGLGLTESDAMNLKFGDVFEISKPLAE